MYNLIFKNKKPSTKTLKTVTLDYQNIITIEKILTGNLKNRYIIKSYQIGIWGQKETSLSAHNINLDYNSKFIKSLEHRSFTFVSGAVSYLDYIITYIYPTWKKRQ